MNKIVKLSAVMVVALLSSTWVVECFAQPPGGGRGGFGGRGMGGFGRGGIAGLLRMEEVKAELKVTEDQAAEIEKAAEQSREAFNFNAIRGASDEDRMKMMRAVQEAMEKVDDQLQAVLDPDQFDRLLGLFAQQAGAESLTNRHVVSALGLSDETVAKLKAKQEEMRPQGFGFGARGGRGEGGRPPEGAPPQGNPPEGTPPEGGRGPGGNFDWEAMRAQMEKVRKEREDALLAILSAEEKEKFEKLKGEKFEFPQFGGFGGRGGRDRGDRPSENN